MKHSTGLVALAAVLASLAAAAPAVARDVSCRIEQQGKVVLDRTCDFQADGRDGSFVLSARGRHGNLLPRISMVTVSVVSPGVAEVRGLTLDGINSRWGEARRSARDGACWEGSDFRICAH
ncbi:hypothetical protein [Phreatobacter stygius]|uniref:Uncharacterized protein n=1 Tax=Phreatobacter stygius TaxID=1940610 RepID=A0A4D7AXR9_9HYPH|nr:hypothetical protein [Phreatobacter stygius]QCI66354.1 hypothetical protein E8M01_20300 [Phreatobacter stygius]